MKGIQPHLERLKEEVAQARSELAEISRSLASARASVATSPTGDYLRAYA